ncbi:hypothetical protein LEMLEM_LOCUS15407 [Lemmus lemmus]
MAASVNITNIQEDAGTLEARIITGSISTNIQVTSGKLG